MTELALRPRRATEILDLAVRLLRRHAGGYLLIALVGVMPSLICRLALLLARVEDSPWAAGALVGGYVVSLLFGAVMAGALLRYGNDVLLTGAGSPRTAIVEAVRRLPVLLAVNLLTSAAVIAGSILLLVPGLYAGMRLTTAMPAAMIEGAGVFGSLRRAWDRGQGHVWHTFSALVLVGLLYLAFFIAVGVAAAVAALTSGFERTLTPALTQIGASLVSAVTYPIFTNVVLLLWYDLRVRHEAYDLELMVASLGTAS